MSNDLDIIEKKSLTVDVEKALYFMRTANLKRVEEFEDEVIKNSLNQVEDLNSNGLNHILCNGMYSRMLIIPKGAYLTGRIHKKPYIDICAFGEITIKNYYENDTFESESLVIGPTYLNGIPGRKRTGLAHADTLWITVDLCEESNIDMAEDCISVPQMKNFRALLGSK